MNKVLKTVSALAIAATAAGAAVVVPALVSAWGDNGGGRPTYTIKQINEGAIDNKIVFNSIVDSNDNLTPKQQESGVVLPLSDERNFVGARLDNGNHGKKNVWNGNEIVAEEGKTYLVRLYVHNNNPKGTAKTAENVTTRLSLPTVASKNARVDGFISSSNATPSLYWDSVTFKSNRNFYLDYVKGSALFENNAIGKNNGVQLPDSLIKGGTKIGYDKLDGRIPGCYGYAGYVTIRVKPVFENTSIEKKVRLKGTKPWHKTIDAKVGDEVEFQIHYKNNNSSAVDNVTVSDSLPNNMKYVAGSTKLFNTTAPNGMSTQDEGLTKGGVGIGGYAVNGDGYVRFTAKIVDKDLICGSNRLINWAKASANGFAVLDYADVFVNKTCKEDPKTPTPDTPNNPNNPDTPNEPTPGTPSELPETGPTEIVSGIVGAGSLITTAGYYVASRKQLR